MRKELDPRLTRIQLGGPLDYGNTGMSGAFAVVGPKGQTLRIISSEGDAEYPWEHISISLEHRCSNWPEMQFVKEMFWDDDECVVQFHPTKDNYVNNHPYVLHMWKYLNAAFPVPPSILVGIKQDGTYANAAEAEEGLRRAVERGDVKLPEIKL